MCCCKNEKQDSILVTIRILCYDMIINIVCKLQCIHKANQRKLASNHLTQLWGFTFNTLVYIYCTWLFPSTCRRECNIIASWNSSSLHVISGIHAGTCVEFKVKLSLLLLVAHALCRLSVVLVLFNTNSLDAYMNVLAYSRCQL